MIPPEPPVVGCSPPERRAAGRGALLFARRSEPLPASTVPAFAPASTGGFGGIIRPSLILLVSSEHPAPRPPCSAAANARTAACSRPTIPADGRKTTPAIPHQPPAQSR